MGGFICPFFLDRRSPNHMLPVYAKRFHFSNDYRCWRGLLYWLHFRAFFCDREKGRHTISKWCLNSFANRVKLLVIANYLIQKIKYLHNVSKVLILTRNTMIVKHTRTHTFSEKVWLLVYFWPLYIQSRNIQGLTPFQKVWESCQIWKSVGPCMFLMK